MTRPLSRDMADREDQWVARRRMYHTDLADLMEPRALLKSHRLVRNTQAVQQTCRVLRKEGAV